MITIFIHTLNTLKKLQQNNSKMVAADSSQNEHEAYNLTATRLAYKRSQSPFKNSRLSLGQLIRLAAQLADYCSEYASPPLYFSLLLLRNKTQNRKASVYSRPRRFASLSLSYIQCIIHACDAERERERDRRMQYRATRTVAESRARRSAGGRTVVVVVDIVRACISI